MLSLNGDMNSAFLDDPYRTDLPLRRVRRRFRQHVVTPIVFLVGALVAVHLGLAVSGVVKDARLNPGALYPNVGLRSHSGGGYADRLCRPALNDPVALAACATRRNQRRERR